MEFAAKLLSKVMAPVARFAENDSLKWINALGAKLLPNASPAVQQQAAKVVVAGSTGFGAANAI